MILPILAELGGSIHVGLAAMGVGIGIGLDRPGNDQRGRSQSRCVHASARARNSRHRIDRGDRFLRSLSRSLIFNGKAIECCARDLVYEHDYCRQ